MDSIRIANYGYVAGPHTIDTDTQLDSSAIANYGYVATKTYSIGFHPELGGYVFRTSPDGKHGLVVAMQDQSGSINWYDTGNIIPNPSNHDINGAKFADWVTTKYELNELYPLRYFWVCFLPTGLLPRTTLVKLGFKILLLMEFNLKIVNMVRVLLDRYAHFK